MDAEEAHERENRNSDQRAKVTWKEALHMLWWRTGLWITMCLFTV